jgi:uncharacterized protein with PIN domain
MTRAKTPPRRRRCPSCNQQLYFVEGEIEQHMQPPPPNGNAPQLCVGDVMKVLRGWNETTWPFLLFSRRGIVEMTKLMKSSPLARES